MHVMRVRSHKGFREVGAAGCSDVSYIIEKHDPFNLLPIVIIPNYVDGMVFLFLAFTSLDDETKPHCYSEALFRHALPA